MVLSSVNQLIPMLGTGIQGVSSMAFSGIPLLGFGPNDLLVFLTQILGALVAVSFVVTRLIKLFVK